MTGDIPRPTPTPEHAAAPRELVVGRLEVCDVDRCLLRTDRFAALVEGCLGGLGIASDSLKREREAVEATGGTFDMVTFLEKNYGDTHLAELVEAVRQEAQKRAGLDYDDENCLLYPGAREIIAAAGLPHVDNGAPLSKSKDLETLRVFLTRGGERSQRLKLAVIGVDVDRMPYAIVPTEDNKTKADRCVDAYQPKQNVFRIDWLTLGGDPGTKPLQQLVVTAGSLVVLDDKLTELWTLGKLPPEVATGLWFRSNEKPSQPGNDKIPLPNIVEVGSLEHVFPRCIGHCALKHTTLELHK